MIRLGRRATLLLALSPLTSAATAFAECAWLASSNFLTSHDGTKLNNRARTIPSSPSLFRSIPRTRVIAARA
jgi:hypothetical protein